MNRDDEFIQKINSLKNQSYPNGLLLKTEHFFIADLIKLYENCNENETEKSQFTLAYYYDVLRNSHFADRNQISKLNQLVGSEDFTSHLKRIKTNNKIPSNNLKEGYFIKPVLSESKSPKLKKTTAFFQKFLLFSFDLKLGDEKWDSLGLNESAIKIEDDS